MDKKLNPRKLWWLISVCVFAFACRSQSTQDDDKKKLQETIEQPRPISDPQLDSLKKVVEEKRRQRTGN
ncbi:MAG: hypothetical protein ACK45I_10485 [Bacteroidota bacterium]